MHLTLEFILGLVRHLMTFGGGALVTDGYVTADDLNTAIGAVCSLIGIAWSMWRKYKRETAE